MLPAPGALPRTGRGPCGYDRGVGKLLYGTMDRSFDVDDRTLLHLRVAILLKLRRGESFALTLEHGRDRGNGRTTLWLNEAIPLQFVFSGNRPASMNRTWVEALIDTAHRVNGMVIVPEPVEQTTMSIDAEE